MITKNFSIMLTIYNVHVNNKLFKRKKGRPTQENCVLKEGRVDNIHHNISFLLQTGKFKKKN
jgi:hypothetical protein